MIKLLFIVMVCVVILLLLKWIFGFSVVCIELGFDGIGCLGEREMLGERDGREMLVEDCNNIIFKIG